MMRELGLAIASAALFVPLAVAQPVSDTTKFQPAIQEAHHCVHNYAPAAYIASVPGPLDVFAYFQQRCYPKFNAAISALGAPDAAPGSFRLIVREEWAQFTAHMGYRR